MTILHHAATKPISKPLAAGIAAAVLSLALAADVSRGQQAQPAAKEPAKPQSTDTSPAVSPGTSKASHAEIEQAIAELGSADFVVRERASRRLWEAGAAAEPALENAARQSDDFEVVYRAGQILQSFQAGIYPDTPPDVAMLILQFRLGNFQMKQVALGALKAKGKTNLLQRLIAKESNPFVREQLNQIMASTGPIAGRRRYSRLYAPTQTTDAAETARRARAKLAQRDFAAAERELGRASGDDAMRDYAALLLGRNTLDAEIKRSRAGLKATDVSGQRRLAWLLRASGDLTGAVAAAKLTGDNGLVADLLTELPDWKELAGLEAKADLDVLAARQDGGRGLARLIAFRHLAGEEQACDLAAAAAMKLLKQQQFRYTYLVNAMVLNDRTDDVVRARSASDPRIAFELLAAQNRLKEAFRLVKLDVPLPAAIDWKAWLKDGKGTVTVERRVLAHHVLRTLNMAGEDQQARALTDALLAMVKDNLPDDGWEMEAYLLMDAGSAAGRPQASDALAAKLLGLDLENPETVIARLYRDQDTLAVLLWHALRKQFPGEERPAALKHLRRLLTGKPDPVDAKQLASLVHRIEPQLETEASEASSAPDDDTADPRGRKLLAVATLFHRYGQSKQVMRYLGLIGSGVSVKTLIDEGNLCADEKQWKEAAKAYQAAWTKDRRSAAALYLLGWAQTKLGQADEGRKQMELALVVPLGDGESRRELSKTLVRLQQDEEAARQRQWVLRLAAMHDGSIAQVLSDIGDAAAEKPETPRMAAVWQRFAVELLVANTGFMLESRYYLQWPSAAHGALARELLRAGKTAEAIQELHRAEASQPTNLQLALDCDADLRKHGAADEAEALYRRMFQRHEDLCRDFPASATYHNDLAWLAANLDRDLDKALTHAQRAVELEPQSAGILDTLAEVHFRRGNRSEAVRLAKRCLEMEPDGEHYKKQLARFEAKPAPAAK